ncbi:hypothetical protein Taro_046541 [Colocasia esculenta]|uniref:Uncharacterized protein n=1 Tax=Colocasia esculenta TaxID=4460 RepID=A0A843X497_COLES|nr:hypothetical protein [Colocasia esculenta]
MLKVNGSTHPKPLGPNGSGNRSRPISRSPDQRLRVEIVGVHVTWEPRASTSVRRQNGFESPQFVLYKIPKIAASRATFTPPPLSVSRHLAPVFSLQNLSISLRTISTSTVVLSVLPCACVLPSEMCYYRVKLVIEAIT